MGAHRLSQRVAHRPGGGAAHHRRRHTKPRVVIDTSDDARLPAVGEQHTTDDIHLPELHRPGPLPALVVGALLAASLRLDKAVTNKTAINRRPPRHRHHPVTLEAMPDRARPPPRMLTTQLHDARLDHRQHLMRAQPRHRRAIHQARQTPRRVTAKPPMHTLTRHPEPTGDLGHRHPAQRLEHGLIALLHQPELHQHGPDPPGRRRSTSSAKKAQHRQARIHGCNAGTGATVAQLPEPRPQSVVDLPEPTCRPPTGTSHPHTANLGCKMVATRSRRGPGAVVRGL
jgi:hypothetical protein